MRLYLWNCFPKQVSSLDNSWRCTDWLKSELKGTSYETHLALGFIFLQFFPQEYLLTFSRIKTLCFLSFEVGSKEMVWGFRIAPVLTLVLWLVYLLDHNLFFGREKEISQVKLDFIFSWRILCYLYYECLKIAGKYTAIDSVIGT